MEQKSIGLIEHYATTYLWEAVAIVLCPLIAFRVVQYVKAVYKSQVDRKPHPIIMHATSFAICSLASTYALNRKHELDDSIFWGVTIAIFAQSIVEFVFRLTAKRAPILNQALQGQIYTDNTTFGHTVIGAIAGAKVVPDARKSQRPTDAEYAASLSEDRTEPM